MALPITVPEKICGPEWHFITEYPPSHPGIRVYKMREAQKSGEYAIWIVKVVICASDNPGRLCVDLDEAVFEKLVQRPLPNVVRIHEIWKEKILTEKFCIRMDYVGSTLKALLDQGNTYVGSFWFDIMGPLANGLLQAHQADIVHGDLKPSNVRVEIDHISGKVADHQVYICDFGIRHWWLNTKNGFKTPGTKQYVAPEIYRDGPSALSEASDVWALGCIGYELFTGLRLFDSERAVERYAYHGELADYAQVHAIEQSHPDISACLAGCMQPDPAVRWGVGHLLDIIVSPLLLAQDRTHTNRENISIIDRGLLKRTRRNRINCNGCHKGIDEDC